VARWNSCPASFRLPSLSFSLHPPREDGHQFGPVCVCFRVSCVACCRRAAAAAAAATRDVAVGWAHEK